MSEHNKIKREIIEIGRRLWVRSYVAANDGNISVKSEENRVLTTPAGVSKGFMTEEDIVTVNTTGEIIEGLCKPSSELPMHLEIYNRRKDIKAIVHAHPPVATGFAAAGLQMDRSILPEVILTLGSITLTPYGTTGTEELAKIVGEGIKNNNGLLLQNHGAVTVGTDVWQAYYRMETLEHFAQITLVTRILGRQSVLNEEEIKKLAYMASIKDSLPVSPAEDRSRVDDKGEKFLISRNELVDLIYKVIQEIKS